MKYKILKIRKRYLNLVRKNIKKHEYRLSAPKYDDLVIGDVLILQSNQNKYDYEMLVSDKAKIKKKYKDMIVDNITLEDLMVLIIKGDKNEGIN